METAPVVFARQVAPEDQARADFYALLSRLYASAPDAPLLAAIAAADELEVPAGDGPAAHLADAWHALIAASAVVDPAAAAVEYQELFVGVGRERGQPPRVSLRESRQRWALAGADPRLADSA